MFLLIATTSRGILWLVRSVRTPCLLFFVHSDVCSRCVLVVTSLRGDLSFNTLQSTVSAACSFYYLTQISLQHGTNLPGNLNIPDLSNPTF